MDKCSPKLSKVGPLGVANVEISARIKERLAGFDSFSVESKNLACQRPKERSRI